MSAKRLDMHRVQELVRLHRMGTGAREAARMLRMSPNTEREYRKAFSAAGLLEGPVDALPELHALRAALPQKTPPQQTSSVAVWSKKVEDLVEKGCGPRAIYDHLRLERDDFSGSYDAIKRLCAAVKRTADPKPEEVAIPVESLPGAIAQVDFGYVGMLYDPVQNVLRKAYVFVMVLGYSRHQFAKVVFDQAATTWQQLHAEAFSYFGGVPEVLVPDNLKAAVVRMAFGIVDEGGLQRGYRELARHYGFKVDPTPPRDPEKKGKVEAGVKYVKNNFFRPREDGEDITVVNAALGRWLVEVAGARVHGTTRRRPVEHFEEQERPTLGSLPPLGWVPALWKLARVHSDSHVIFDKRLYSVPWTLLRQQVWVRATPDSVYIYDLLDNRVATHERKSSGPRSTLDAHLPEFRRDLRHRGDAYWTKRGQAIGSEVGEWVREMFDEGDAFSPLRVVQQVVVLLEKYPQDRAINTCRRARHFGIRTYAGIKEILTRALDFESLPPALPFPNVTETTPRFARSAGELVMGVSRGIH